MARRYETALPASSQFALTEPIDWMIDRIPEEERAERQAEQERLSSLLGDLDLPNDADGATSVAPTVSKGGADA